MIEGVNMPKSTAMISPEAARWKVAIGPQLPPGYTMERLPHNRLGPFRWSLKVTDDMTVCGEPGTFMEAFRGAWTDRSKKRNRQVGGRIAS